jgi:hypothetical protein
VTKFIEVSAMNLVTPDATAKDEFCVQMSVMNLLIAKAAPEHELLFKDPASKAGFLSIAVRLKYHNKVLPNSEKCSSVCHEFGHT